MKVFLPPWPEQARFSLHNIGHKDWGTNISKLIVSMTIVNHSAPELVEGELIVRF